MGTAETQQLTGIAAHIIKRPRLTKILDETEARIILLCAPAGYGKTTLAREWVATRSEPVYWYSGGPAMADVAALAVDLAGTFNRGDGLCEQIRSLAAGGESAAAIGRALSGAIQPESILAIDDFQYANGHDEPVALIRELVKQSGCRLLLTSRVRPALVEARRAIYGEALVLTAQELAFSDAEAAAVLPEYEELRETTRGWPAVIGLAAMSRGIGSNQTALNPSDLYEYLATELFAAVDDDLRLDFIRLGLGGDASPDVAHEVLGSRFESTVRAARDQGFVVYRPDAFISLHPLIRDFLLRKATEIEPAARVKAVDAVLRTLISHEEWDACLTLLRVFPRSQLGAVAMRQALPELLRAGRTMTVKEWSDWAEESHNHDPVFILGRAELALRSGAYVEARSLGAEAARALEGDLAARAYLNVARADHQLDLHDGTRDNARRAAELAEDVDLRTEALWLQFADAHERDARETALALQRLREMPDERPEHSLRLACAEGFVLSGPEGNLRLALDAAETAAALSQAVRDPYLRTNGLHLRAHLLRAVGDYTQALEAISALEREAEASGLDFVLDHARIAKAASLCGLRLLSDTRRVLRELERRGAAMNTHIRVSTLLTKARLFITMGDLASAEQVMAAEPPARPLSLFEEFVSLRVLIATAAGTMSGWDDSLHARPTQYIEAIATAQMADCIGSLRRPTRETSIVDTVIDLLERGCGDVVVIAVRAYPALAGAVARGDAKQRLRELLISANDYDIGRRAGLTMPRVSRRGTVLTDREQEILDLLAEGRTNNEIAKTLFISESTTKVHVRHIFDKLDVNTRAEAVSVALQRRDS